MFSQNLDSNIIESKVWPKSDFSVILLDYFFVNIKILGAKIQILLKVTFGQNRTFLLFCWIIFC